MRRIDLALAILATGSLLLAACGEQSHRTAPADAPAAEADKAPTHLHLPQQFLQDLMTDFLNVPESEWVEVTFEDLVADTPQTEQPGNFVVGETMTVTLQEPEGLPVPPPHTIRIETTRYPVDTPGGCILFRVWGLQGYNEYNIESWFPAWADENDIGQGAFSFYELVDDDPADPYNDLYVEWITSLVLDQSGINAPLNVVMHGDGLGLPDRSYWVGDPNAPGDD